MSFVRWTDPLSKFGVPCGDLMVIGQASSKHTTCQSLFDRNCASRMRARRTGSLNAEPKRRVRANPQIPVFDLLPSNAPCRRRFRYSQAPTRRSPFVAPQAGPRGSPEQIRPPPGISRPLRCRCRIDEANHQPLCMTTVGLI